MKFVMPVQGKSAQDLYDLNREGVGGFYPIGLNNSYHGGMHFEGDKLPIVAIADGEIIAYRYSKDYVEEKKGDKVFRYSNSFVLIQHEFETNKKNKLTFYSLYHHLSPWNELNTWVKSDDKRPNIIVKPGYKLKKGKTLNIHSSAELSTKEKDNITGTFSKEHEVIATPSKDHPGWAKVENDTNINEYIYISPQYVTKKSIICDPKFDEIQLCKYPIKAGTLIGYPGLCESEGAEKYRAVHIEVFAGDDADDFINNAEKDGSNTLLKISAGKELKNRTKKYDRSKLNKFSRSKGTIVEHEQDGDGSWVRVVDKEFIFTINHDWLNDKYDTHLKHYTIKSEYIDQVKNEIKFDEITGEDPTIPKILETNTSATHLKRIHIKGNDRVVSIEAGSAAKHYWIERSTLIHKNELKANYDDCYSEDPDAAIYTTVGNTNNQCTGKGTIPFDCVITSKDRIKDTKGTWYYIEVDGISGWINESDVTKVSPYDWTECGFSIIKESNNDSWSITEPSEENAQIKYDKLPTFFKSIFDQIDLTHDHTIDDHELRHAFQDKTIALQLSRLICYNQTEWWASNPHYQKIIGYAQKLGGSDTLRTRINKLSWWGHVGLSINTKVFHWNPVAFIEQMSLINSSGTVVWGSKVSHEFKKKLFNICDELKIDPNYMMACIAFESAKTFSPSIVNPHSGAVGLIQFMRPTALLLNTTTEKLKAMTAVEQLDYVRLFFLPHKGRCKSLEDVYMAIIWPAAIGKSNDYVLFSQGTIYYTQNSGLDTNKDGKITKDEAAGQVRNRLIEGRKYEG